jgi:nicotinate phosphoribosyltransferase
MKYLPMIKSLLENDAYKFSMPQVIYHYFNNYVTEWTFKCRSDVKFTKEDIDEITEQIKYYCTLKFTDEELQWLAKTVYWLKYDYIETLRNYQPRFEDFKISHEGTKGISIKVVGPWHRVSFYETPVLAIVNEVYFRNHYDYESLLTSAKKKLSDKITKLLLGDYNLGAFSDFGFRRRLSGEFQDYAVNALINPTSVANSQIINTKYNDSIFVGTSNVYLAKKYNVTPVGTMAHEYIMGLGQGDITKNPAFSNERAMRYWTKEYGMLLGTMLTDTIGTKYCMDDMKYTYTAQFSGVRHDSGDPYKWGDSWIEHYNKYYSKFHDERCNPKNKTLLFSDSLDFERATKIRDYFKDKVKVAFGIGTYICNDTDVPALNIVMKMTQCGIADFKGDWKLHPVAKLSDVPGKNMCESSEYIDWLKDQLSSRDYFEEGKWEYDMKISEEDQSKFDYSDFFVDDSTEE